MNPKGWSLRQFLRSSESLACAIPDMAMDEPDSRLFGLAFKKKGL